MLSLSKLVKLAIPIAEPIQRYPLGNAGFVYDELSITDTAKGIQKSHPIRYQNTDLVKALPGITSNPLKQFVLNDYVKKISC